MSWFYGFALGLVGIAVFGVIIYGAILYTISAGNASKQADAKEWITAAIWGFFLLLAAYLILWTINKDIVDLNKIQSFLEKGLSRLKQRRFRAEAEHSAAKAAKAAGKEVDAATTKCL